MDMTSIAYTKGYKYQLRKDHSHQTSIKPPRPIVTAFLELDTDGLLTAKRGYAWDGPSGPTFDTKTFMRGSLVHDCFYQLFRDGLLDPRLYRAAADLLLREICRQDGMSRPRAWWVYHAVRKFGPRYHQPRPKPIIYAPRGIDI